MRENNKAVATLKARQMFWTDLMFREELDIKVRIKASELLGKSENDFSEIDEATSETCFSLADLLDGV